MTSTDRSRPERNSKHHNSETDQDQLTKGQTSGGINIKVPEKEQEDTGALDNTVQLGCDLSCRFRA